MELNSIFSDFICHGARLATRPARDAMQKTLVFLENPAMRLSQDQVQAIKFTAQTVLGNDARVTLFGSRTDDHRRGGDIDLLFETPHRLHDRANTCATARPLCWLSPERRPAQSWC